MVERYFGPHTKVESNGAIIRTTSESPLYRVLRQGGRVSIKVGKDFAELTKAIPWKNHMLHTIIASTIWYKSGGGEWLNETRNDLLRRVHTFEAAMSGVTAQLPTEAQTTLIPTPIVTPEVTLTIAPSEIVISKQHLYYEVRKGDTLYSISRRFGTTVEALAEANQIFNPRLIYSGQILYVISHVSTGEVIHDLLTPEERLKADKSYEGIYYHPGELNSSPGRQEGLVHVYGLGEPLNPNYASGFPFEKEEFGCATWFYPIGTWLKVTNVANNEVVYCRVKDRGPNRVKYSDIIADLTKGARDEIAPSWVGEIQVTIEPAK